MNFYRNNWFYFSIIWFIVIAFYMLFWGVHCFSPLQIILIASFMALLIHQFEEYVLPGGGPVVVNKATFNERALFRNFPGNMHSSMIVNHLAYAIYLVAIIFSDLIWLGVATMFFNLFQLFGHGLQMNRVLNTWYNPGLASVIFLFIPISVYYFIFIIDNDLITSIGWFYGTSAFVGMVLFSTILPVQLLKNKKSPYVIPEWQVQQQEKLQHKFCLKK
ncbi:MAG: HXXEE domain-containing protein [Capnocytophaga sp.]|nr:HXXEE domain-containing protein [Capnocytophaga sp.]